MMLTYTVGYLGILYRKITNNANFKNGYKYKKY